MFAAAVGADTKEAAAAKAFIDFLQTPEAAAVLKAKGMTPANAATRRSSDYLLSNL